jgi:single-strand DNA-binding protein
METWSKLADICYNLGRKGRGVRVVGRFKQERWNDAGGKTHSKISIAAEHVESRPELKHEETPESAELSNG